MGTFGGDKKMRNTSHNVLKRLNRFRICLNKNMAGYLMVNHKDNAEEVFAPSALFHFIMKLIIKIKIEPGSVILRHVRIRLSQF